MANTQLQEYVGQARASGMRDDAIREALATQGWPSSDVNEAFVMTRSAAPAAPAAPRRPLMLVVAIAALAMIAAGAVAYVFIMQKTSAPSAPTSELPALSPTAVGSERPWSVFASDPGHILANIEWSDGKEMLYGLAVSGTVDLRAGAETAYQGTLFLSDFPRSRMPLRTRFSSYFAWAKDTLYFSLRQPSRGSIPPMDRLLASQGLWARASAAETRAALMKVAPELEPQLLPWIELTPEKARALRKAFAESGSVTVTDPAAGRNEELGVTVYVGKMHGEQFRSFLEKAYRILTGREPDAVAHDAIARATEYFDGINMLVEVKDSTQDITRIASMREDPPEDGYRGPTMFSLIWTPTTESLDMAYASATATLDAFIK